MVSSEQALKDKILSLLENSANDAPFWLAFLKGVPLYQITHGELESIRETKWSLSRIMQELPPTQEEVARDKVVERPIRQDLPSRALEGTEWDANGVTPDIILETPTAYVMIEVKGENGHFHGTGQPLQIARYLVLTPPDRNKRRAMLLAAPERFFKSHPANTRNWEIWQLEFRRLQGVDPKFYWGILLGEDIEKLAASQR